MSAAGINFIDVYYRSGLYPTALPFIPGVEGAGKVIAVGSEVAGIAVGDPVAWANVLGSYAGQVSVPADRVVPLPPEIDERTAAAVLLQGMTAHYLTHETCPTRPGDTVLVHAAAGGMGLLLTQLIKLRGGRVIGTVSSAAKEQLARSAGADEVVRYSATHVAAAVRELTDGEGVAAVFDGVGAPTFETSLAALRPRGVLAVYGQAGGQVPLVDLQRLNSAGSVYVTRPNLAHYIANCNELRNRARDVFAWIASGELSVHIGGSYPLAEATTAHKELEERRSSGKLLLLSSDED
jgi:NADPH2:quinone reductase